MQALPCHLAHLRLLAVLASCVFMLACSKQSTIDTKEFDVAVIQPINAKYSEPLDAHFKLPNFSEIDLKVQAPGAAIWGATGRDNDGNLYFGLSTYSGINDTAYLVKYNPRTGISELQSDTISELKNARLYVEGMSQNKLHSKFFMAEDGYLYFSSFDEVGETKSRNPIYGGNLWRKLPESDSWEHLVATEHALMAVNVHGRYVYALGYWGHILYQYDIISQRTNRITVGSVDGHISRNFVVNKRGHVFVPRVERSADGKMSAALVEVAPSMAITDVHPLEDYANEDGFGSHGIVAYTLMQNGDAYFTTSPGGLYHIGESSTGRHAVNYLGKFEPQYQNSYIASMFSPDGESLLVGLGRNKETKGYYWYIRELNTQLTVNYPIESLQNEAYLLYGSITTDDEGNMYIVGRDTSNRSRHRPVVIKASYSEP